MNQLIISDYGTYLGKHSERVSVRYRDKAREKEEHAMMDLDQIVIASRGVSVSSDLIEACTERGIEISFLSFNGVPYAKLNSPSLTATVISRREQLAAYHDERGLEIAKRFAGGKLQNQVNTVRYFGKYRKKQAPKKYAELTERLTKIQELIEKIQHVQPATVVPAGEPPIDNARATLLNLEGRAGALYWECVQRLLPAGRFTTRNHQGAVDDVNALLNYGYGILYSQIWSALSLAGLEPFAGFLHVDRPGKPSLVLDFIEEFRQTVVDRVVFAMINKRFNVEWEEPDSGAAKAAHQASKSDSTAEITSQTTSKSGHAPCNCRSRARATSRNTTVRTERAETLQHHPTPSPPSGDVPATRTRLPTLNRRMVTNRSLKPSFFPKLGFLRNDKCETSYSKPDTINLTYYLSPS